jgi:hypothetical protein
MPNARLQATVYGSVLALKTIISILLGATSGLAMAVIGLEFAAFRAIPIVRS